MRKLTKITTTLLTLGILASTGTAAFATTASTTTTETRVELTEEQKAERLEKMKERLAEDLADGKITQEQYDQMLSSMESGEFHMNRGGGKMEELTDEQKEEMLTKMKERLAEELAEGKITQDQYDESIADIEAGNFPAGGRHGDGEERPEMTDEQKAERLTEMKEKLAEELAEGKITQDQYDEMISNMENGTMPMRGRGNREVQQES